MVTQYITCEPKPPRLGVFKLASCDGCQLTLLDCEDELLLLASIIDIEHFPEAVSLKEGKKACVEEPFDLAIIEGSVSTPEQLQLVQQIRSQSRMLITIGACATSGGIQALRNFANHEEYRELVYARPEYIASLATSTPVSQHVRVDFELRGCPIDKGQLLEVISAFIRGRTPVIKNESVCFECKRRGAVCIVVAHGTPCLGPVTHAGCGAICPAYKRGCYGCFGPRESAATRSLVTNMKSLGKSDKEILRSFRLFTAASPEFEDESRRHE